MSYGNYKYIARYKCNYSEVSQFLYLWNIFQFIIKKKCVKINCGKIDNYVNK